METTIVRADVVGRREAAALATGTATKLFASQSAGRQRQAVRIRNADASTTIYVRYASDDSTPAITASTADESIQPGSVLSLPFGAGIDVWLWQNSGAPVNYVAVELA
jgi:hypothetical protein